MNGLRSLNIAFTLQNNDAFWRDQKLPVYAAINFFHERPLKWIQKTFCHTDKVYIIKY